MVSLRTLVLENLTLKLTALLLALLMWLGVSGQTFEDRIIRNVRLELSNKPEELEIMGTSSSTFEVQIRSPRRRTVLEEELAVVVDLSNAQEGSPVFPLNPTASVRAPDGVGPIGVNPSRLVVTLELTTSKAVPVQPRFSGRAADGFEVVEVLADPANVTIAGPRSRVKLVERVTTEAISLALRNSSFDTAVNVIGEEAEVRIDQLDPVRVSVEIREKRRPLKVSVIPIEVLGAPGRYRLRTSRVTAEVSVPLSFTEELKPEFFMAVLNVEGLEVSRTDHEVVPQVTLKDIYSFDVEVLSVEPSTVRIRLSAP